MRQALASISFLAFLSLPVSAARAADALLVVVDRSESMASLNKWTFASQGIVDALDQAGFDAFEVGLISAPSGQVTGPACVFSFPISCQSPSLPQVPIGPAGAKSFVGPGKRRDILDWLTGNPPNLDGVRPRARPDLRGWFRGLQHPTPGSISVTTGYSVRAE